MATTFPTSLDVLNNPQGTDSVQAVPHAAQHADANDAIEALQSKVGVDGSTDPNSLDKRVSTLENQSVDTESIQDIVAGVLEAGTHTNITVTYDDIANKINLASTYGDEQVMDAIALSLTAGTGITKTYDDVANTITVSVDTSSIATQSYVTTAISNLIDSSPALLNTLNEIAAAIGNDPNFATTITNALSNKLDSNYVTIGNTLLEGISGQTYGLIGTSAYLDVKNTNGYNKEIELDITAVESKLETDGFAKTNSPTFTGTPLAPTAIINTNTTQVATTEFVQSATTAAVTSSNEYTDEAVAGLGNSLPNIYVPISDIGVADGIASLNSTGKVPDTQLDIDERIQDVAAKLITDGTHTNISVSYDDITQKLNFVSEGGASVSIVPNAPASPSAGDLWLDSDTATLYAYDGSFWVEISGAGGGGSTGGSGNFTLAETAPTSPTSGDTWFHTGTAKLYVYYDSFWVEAIASGATGATGPSFLEYRGLWNSGVSYLENDGVTYIGSLWRLNEVNSPAGTIPSTPNWQLVIQKGDKGDTGEITIGTVETILFGETPTVINTGTTTDAILNFEIPGGRASTLEVGTVDTVTYGNPLTIVNSGTVSDAVFDFEIPAGRAATIAVGTVDDVLYGNPPTVVNSGDTSDAVFDFEIPAGRASTLTIGTVTTVVDGEPATVVNSGDTSDAVFDFEIPAGPRSTITIGTVDDVDFGTAPTVTNSGTTSDAIFDFELTTGRASTLAVGTVTTGSYASSATVTNAGTSSDAVFNFSIPQGIPGDFQPGETPPANPLAGQVWYNTASGRAYVYHDSFWVEFSPGFVGQPGATGPAGPAGTNGTNGSSITPLAVSSNITLQKDYSYFVDTSAARTLTLPATPALGDTITIYDAYGTAATNNITISRNSTKINGQTEDAIIDVDQAISIFVYTGTTLGWRFE